MTRKRDTNWCACVRYRDFFEARLLSEKRTAEGGEKVNSSAAFLSNFICQNDTRLAAVLPVRNKHGETWLNTFQLSAPNTRSISDPQQSTTKQSNFFSNVLYFTLSASLVSFTIQPFFPFSSLPSFPSLPFPLFPFLPSPPFPFHLFSF